MGDITRVFFEAYGCSFSQAETQAMAGAASRHGYEIVKCPENADAMIINTCSVKEATVTKILFRIKEMRSLYPSVPVIATGCMAITERSEIERAGGIAMPNGIGKAPDISGIVSGSIRETFKYDPVCVPKCRENEAVDIVPICSGCDSACTFCATKFARGNIRSFPEDRIIKEIESAKNFGAKEFWITGQDISAFGIDISCEHSLPGLLSSITDKVGGKYFIRLGMLNPKHLKCFSNELLRTFHDQRIFKFLHIPVQSGSDDVLKSMKRGHTSEDFVEIVGKFRRHFPGITVWTDIITGFPGETSDDFELSMKLVRETRPDFVNVSGFSSHRIAPASRMKQVPTNVRKERTGKMALLVKEICIDKNREWIGWEGEALVDEYNKVHGNYIARNFAYKPIAIRSRENLIGKFVKVRIDGALPTCLLGSLKI